MTPSQIADRIATAYEVADYYTENSSYKGITEVWMKIEELDLTKAQMAAGLLELICRGWMVGPDSNQKTLDENQVEFRITMATGQMVDIIQAP